MVTFMEAIDTPTPTDILMEAIDTPTPTNILTETHTLYVHFGIIILFIR